MPSRTDNILFLEFGLRRGCVTCPMYPARRHSEIEFAMPVGGECLYLIGGHRMRLREGCQILFWGGMPHRMLELSPPVRFEWVTVSLSWFLQSSLPQELTAQVLGGSVLITEEPDDALTVQLFQRWQKDLESGSAESEHIVLLELDAQLRRFALSQGGGRSPSAPQGSSHIEQMMRFVGGNFTRQLSVKDIAAAVDLNPRYANTLFRSKLGCSLMEYTRQHRVVWAQHLLATTDLQMWEVAKESGFGSVVRFHAVFKAACNCTPRAFRVGVRQLSGSLK